MDSFHSGTGTSKWNQVCKFSTSSMLPWRKQQVTDLLIFSCSLSPATIAGPWSFCHVSVFFAFQIFKRFFNHDFWLACTKCSCGNWQVAFGAWLLVQLLQPLLLVEVQCKSTLLLSAKFSAQSELNDFFWLLWPCHCRRKWTQPLLFFQGFWTNLAACIICMITWHHYTLWFVLWRVDMQVTPEWQNLSTGN